jgi:hypothetical protein
MAGSGSGTCFRRAGSFSVSPKATNRRYEMTLVKCFLAAVELHEVISPKFQHLTQIPAAAAKSAFSWPCTRAGVIHWRGECSNFDSFISYGPLPRRSRKSIGGCIFDVWSPEFYGLASGGYRESVRDGANGDLNRATILS